MPTPHCFCAVPGQATASLLASAQPPTAAPPTFGSALALAYDPNGDMPPHLALVDGGSAVYVYPLASTHGRFMMEEPLLFTAAFQVEDITITLGAP